MSQHPEGSQSTTATSGVESVQRPNLPLQGPRSDDTSRSARTSTFGPFLDYLLLNYYGANSANNSAPYGGSVAWQKRRNSPPPDHSSNMRPDERLCGLRCYR